MGRETKSGDECCYRKEPQAIYNSAFYLGHTAESPAELSKNILPVPETQRFFFKVIILG